MFIVKVECQQLTSLRQEKAARISRTEGTNGSNKILRIRKANVATAIKLGIGKRIAGSRLQIKKGEKESEFKAIIQEENPGIEINSMEVVAEDE